MSGDVHVRFLEELRVKIPWSTQPYIKSEGRWCYFYRAIDKDGNSIDVYLSDKRNINVAETFFKQAIKITGFTLS